MVRRQLRLHRRRDPDRARRASRTSATSSRTSSANTDLDPYTADDVPRRHAPRHARARRRGDGARPRRRLGRRGALAARQGPALPAHVRPPGRRGRRPPAVLGRARARHRRRRRGAHGPAPRGRAARRDRAAPRHRGRGPPARRRRRLQRRCGPHRRRDADELEGGARSCSPRAASIQPADARGAPRPELGRREGPRHPAQHGRGAAGGARPRRAGLRALERLPRDPVGRGRAPTGDRELTNRYSRQSYPVAIVVNARRRALHRRGRGLPQLHLRQVRRGRCCASRRGSRRRSSTRTRCGCCARSTTRRPAPRAPTPARSPSWPRRWASTPSASSAPSRTSTRPIGPGDFDPTIKDGKGTRGIDPPKSNWALPRRAAAVHRVPGHLRDHLHLRRRARGRGRAACSTPRGRPLPGLFAAGELVGGLFFHNYPGGTGLTAGAVYGRRAGYAAAA